MKRWKIAGVNFDHFHMGDLLRYAKEHKNAEVVGISDTKPERMEEAIQKLGIPREHVYVSMERNMKCALGHCGHCQYGPHFICKDGPVFSYAQIQALFKIREV